jgi:hypothetical protein
VIVRGTPRGGIDLVERVAVALEEPDPVEAQPEDLVAIDRLQEAPQGLGVEAVGHDDHLDDGPLKPDHPKQARPTQHGQSIQRVVPEGNIVGEGFEWFEERSLTRLRNRIWSC